MIIEMVKMSSKGQIVIPQHVREELHAEEGSVFAVMSSKDSVILKKVPMPSKQELVRSLEKIAQEGRKRAERLGIQESNVPEIVSRMRKVKRA